MVSEVTALLREEEGGPIPVGTAFPSVRLEFLRKVYGILASQLLLTLAICTIFMYVPWVRNTVLSLSALITIAAIIGSFVTLFALMLDNQTYPRNALLLFAFTVLQSLLIGTVCASYAEEGLGFLVLEALVITFFVFSGITLYAFTSKQDFSFMGGALYTALVGLLVCSVTNSLLDFTGHRSKIFAFALSFSASVLFSFFILYDTSLIMNHLGPDDSLLAAIMLYTDLLNLFLHILAIISEAQER